MKTFAELREYIHALIADPAPVKVDGALKDFVDVVETLEDIPAPFHSALAHMLILMSREKLRPEIKQLLKMRLKREIQELKNYYNLTHK